MIIDKENLFGKDVSLTPSLLVFPDVIDLGADHAYIADLKERGGDGKIFISFKDVTGSPSTVSFFIESSDDPTFASGIVLGDYIDVSQSKMNQNKSVSFGLNVATSKRYIRLLKSGSIPTGTATAGFVLDSHNNEF